MINGKNRNEIWLHDTEILMDLYKQQCFASKLRNKATGKVSYFNSLEVTYSEHKTP